MRDVITEQSLRLTFAESFLITDIKSVGWIRQDTKFVSQLFDNQPSNPFYQVCFY